MAEAQLAAVLFDLDGTLVDSERESAEAMARALRHVGVLIDQADRDYMIGRSWVAIYERVRDRYPAMPLARDALITATVHEREAILAQQGITVLPGAVEAVGRFAMLPRALVTGSSRREADQILGAIGLRRTFVPTICAEDVPRSKPDPAGYLAACAQLGVSPAQCLVLEDSQAGIAAGLAAGCVVVGVAAGNFDGQDQSRAHAILPSLLELTVPWAQALIGRTSPQRGEVAT